MAASVRPKIVYILPEYNPAAGSHFFHLYEMLGRVQQELDVFLVIEKAKRGGATTSYDRSNLSHGAGGAYCQRFSFAPFRFLELLTVCARERLRGRRSFYTHYSFYGALASWLVTRLLGGTAYYWNCGMPWRYRRGRLEEAVFRFVLRHTILVTGTAGLAEEYARRYDLDPARIRILPNWVNVARFRNTEYKYDRNYVRQKFGVPRDAKVVLFVHRLSRRKGAHLLADILAGVIRQRQDVMLLVVGEGPERESLELKVKSLKLEPYVRIVGEVPNRDLPAYYRAANAFLMPSEEEGFPHVLLEAMASGLPYVASDVGGVREITPPELQPFILPSGNIADMTAALNKLFTEPFPGIQRLAEVEREWVSRYDVSAARRRFALLFDNSFRE